MSHPAAIVFVGVNPQRTKARVFRAWRGDKVKTSAGDVYDVYKSMVEQIGRAPVVKSYDYESADFGIIAERAGDFWYRAEKNVAKGEELLNSMFRFNVLELDMNDNEINKLSSELQSISRDSKFQKDDLASALRYLSMKLNMDWSTISANNNQKTEEKIVNKENIDDSGEKRRQYYMTPEGEGLFEGVEEEMEFWQDLMD
jgi:hypothetical protein